MRFRMLHSLVAAALTVVAFGAAAQDYPSRTITFEMPYSPGGPGDAITRVFARC